MTGPVIPIRAGNGPDRRRLGAEDWARGATFLEFVEASPLRAAVEAAFRRTMLPPADIDAIAALQPTLRIVVFAAGDDLAAAVNIAHAEQLFAQGKNLWLRVFDPQDTADLVERFLGKNASASSRFAFFLADGRACNHWGPHPARLQAECDTLSTAESATRRNAFYTQSDGRDQVAEWRVILTACAAGASGAPLAPPGEH